MTPRGLSSAPQVMGNGVADSEPFPALLSINGQAIRNLYRGTASATHSGPRRSTSTDILQPAWWSSSTK